MAAPRTKPQKVGGEYRIRGDAESEDGDEGDDMSGWSYVSLSDCIVIES
jgi:hypothetical protein